MEESQIILVDKPAGISSFGVVAKVRGFLRAEFGHKVKVGHTGTLDPFATGLLILLSGKMTKKSNEFLKQDKIYEATLKLGFTSTTGDPEGIITEYDRKKNDSETTHPEQIQMSLVEDISEPDKARIRMFSPVATGENAPCPKLNDIEFVLGSFTSKIQQTPPRFSAIKIGGERAYKLARSGQDFEIPSREIEIYSIDILNYDYPELKIRVHCSSGTYIRTLAEDIGKKLGTGAYLTTLRRTKIASFSVADALPLSRFTDNLKAKNS